VQRCWATRLRRFAGFVTAATFLVACGGDAEVGEPVSPTNEASETGQAETQSAATGSSAAGGSRAIVAEVIDGDTLELGNGAKVRLLQIDAPETGGECYSRGATQVLREMLPDGTKVRLEVDPKLDKRDRYGRLLRYVFKEEMHVNLELVRRGAASVWFYQGERGRYAKELMRAAGKAKADEVGLWQARRGTELDPLYAIEATSQLADESAEPMPAVPSAPPAEPAPSGCDSSYPDFCIPPPPPDLDCDQVNGNTFAVRPPDSHGFDGNGDGVGCEGER
jgi:endonuclease YncB( thermonuclease family)